MRIFSALVSLVTLLLIAGTSLANSDRVHYSVRGSGRDITVQADSSSEARRIVMDMFPGAVVTGWPRGFRAPRTRAFFEFYKPAVLIRNPMMKKELWQCPPLHPAAEMLPMMPWSSP
jgi:hypothetical protein